MLMMIPFLDFRLDPKLTITIMCKVSLLAACFHFHFSFAAKLKISREIFCGCFCCCCSHRHVAPANKFICLNTRRRNDNEDTRHSPRGAALRTAPAPAPVPCSLLLLHLQPGQPYDFADSLSPIAGIKFFRFSVLLWSYI